MRADFGFGMCSASDQERTTTMLPHHKRTWALVMNATRARIVRDIHQRPGEAQTELVLKTEAHKLKDIMSDRPGRSFSSGSAGRRSAMAYGSDPLEEDERVFARQVLTLLDTHRRSEDFDALAIYAEPHTLGMIRKEMPAGLRDLVVKEVAKNLVHLSPHDLQETLSADIGPPVRVR
jgi:protein required for attachment to host cells